MIQSVVGGHTPIAFSSLPPAAPQIKAGTSARSPSLRDKRIDSLPDVPTMAEAGYPGQEGDTPMACWCRPARRKPIVDFLHREVDEDHADRGCEAEAWRRSVLMPIGNTPAEFAAFLKVEGAKWGKVIKDAGIKLE